ncbi:MAG: pseudouridylate synthase [Sulfurimonas sp. RIFOXYD12_FULL_33_39]|uniref:tRNA pseudouridine(65) synthase TruC n=1 Tax=unclassified Sulfurimonas TaxID=2623549 RepID=UPI0008ABD276|nr:MULTISPECIES: tRNA pseudouridine(65) synthase TruC [unclassified Sulfurimonas]OHE09077.1 MAG: pseudouridylate synthase [Sulfurimonas sp. RIFOXYD12_FULL_33_39]OHE14394.1 MAG: pseudouridylate synthase [Sulfurimonas sp. RIFOXYD2_FULL_34_21]
MLEILYKDEFLVAINKPSGLLVHRSPIDRHETRFAVQILREQIGRFVYPVHRLDKPTSGVLLFALDKESAKIMGEQFSLRESKKSYIAVVRGYTDESGVIEHALSVKLDKIADKDSTCKEAQDASTKYERLETIELPFSVGKYDVTRYSLVKLKPLTGRKHQLRRHMKHISHHILGDTKYGRGEHNKFIREKFGCHRMLLHASKLQIKHPYSDEILTIKAPLDDTFTSICKFFNWHI